jgi:hypothetical protein
MIIGGVMLTAILVTSVFAFFFTILQNEQARAGYQIQATQADQDQSTEIFTVDRDEGLVNVGGNLYIRIHINNEGPLPLRYSHLLLYCISGTCPSPDPIENPASVVPALPQTLNAGESSDDRPGSEDGIEVGPVLNEAKYRIDVISERGNIVSAIECEVAIDVCVVPPGGGGPGSGGDPGNDPEGIIQGTGSLQLDYKSFGAIFPQFASRDGVDQTGWLARSANATGYPAFMLPAGPQVYLVERVRNLDPEGYAIDLSRSSGMTLSHGKCTAGQCPPVYLCNADTDGVSSTTTTGNLVQGTQAPLNDPTTFVSIPATPQTAGRYEGWMDLLLCSRSQNSLDAWNVQEQMSNINTAFMVARGAYGGTSFSYAQTIPYQSLIVAHQGSNNYGNNFNIVPPNLIACLRDVDVSTLCPSPTAADASPTLHYQGAAGDTLDIHINNVDCNCGYYVSWIYPSSGQAISLPNPNVDDGLDENNSIEITLPTTNEDGTPLDLGEYTLKLTTGYNSNNARDVYYFTFRITP